MANQPVAVPTDGNGRPFVFPLWDPTNHQWVIPQGAPGTLDANGNVTYGPLVVQQNASQSVNGTLQNAAAANGNGTPLALLGMSSVIFTVNMSGFTGTVNFECTEDGTNYDPLQVQQEGTNVIATSVVGSTSTSIHLYEASVAGLQNVRARVSGFSAGTVTVTAHAIPSTDAPRAINAVPVDGQKATYAASITQLAVAASATDIFTLTGSATKTIRVTRLRVSGIKTTAGADVDVQLIIRSTADTAGTKTNPTAIPYDSNNPAATAVVAAYTANPTLGTAVGTFGVDSLFIPLATASGGQLDYMFGARAQAIVLRGAAQQLAVNLNGVTVGGGGFDIWVEWTEE